MVLEISSVVEHSLVCFQHLFTTWGKYLVGGGKNLKQDWFWFIVSV